MSGTPSDKPLKDSNINQKDNILGKMLKIAAYPISGFLGYWAAAPMVNNAAYDNLKHRGVFDDINRQHKDEMDTLFKRYRAGEGVDLIAETHRLRGIQYERVGECFKEMKLGTLSDQWQFIHKTQRNEALLTAITVASISIGALLTIANSRSMSLLFDVDEKGSAQER